MTVETKPKIEGVAAFIVLPRYHRVLTIEELETKEKTNKIAGMRSIPMETVEPGENYEQAMRRLLKEEVNAEPLPTQDITGIKLCSGQMVPDVWVHTFLLQASSLTRISLGTHAREVTNPLWEHVNNLAYHEMGSRKYRGLNRESAFSYYDWFNGRSMPNIYENIIDRVSAEEFEALRVQNTTPFQPFAGVLPGLIPHPIIH